MGFVRTIIRKAGTIIGIRRTINLIEGANITLTVADDIPNDRVNVTISSSGGGSLPTQTGNNGKYLTTDGSNASWQNTPNTTTIVGITGTKAEFNTAVTDGDILYVGDITQYVAPNLNIDKLIVTTNQTITAGYGSVISRIYKINSGIKLTIDLGGRLRII